MKLFGQLLDRFLIVKRLILFVIAFFISLQLYRIALDVLDRSTALGVIVVWFFIAYLVLPRIHRFLTKVYVPDYFLGRTRTGDGLLGDPVNLAVNGTLKDLKWHMKQAGWVEAEPLNIKTTLKMISASLRRKSYPSAPVSSLYLFSEKQTIAFQQEVGGSTKERHHVRFWKCPDGWLLPGGFRADYLGAATYDRRVGLSLYTFQITHKIEENTDIERDYVVDSLRKQKGTEVSVVKNFSSGYHHRNGGGDTIQTDGSLPFIGLKNAK